jgi:hypothetical protein
VGSNLFLNVPTKGDPVIINNFRVLQEFMKKVGEQTSDIMKVVDVTTPPGSTVMVSANDKKADYLLNKLVASTGITLTENHNGGIEDISIAAHVPVTLATNHGLGLSGQLLNMGTPSTCTAATTNSVTTTTHTHAITGFLTTVTAHNILSATHGDSTVGSATAGDIIYADANPKWTKLAKATDGWVLTLVSGLPAWAVAATGGGNHDLLSATHTDTTASAVVRGDIIIGTGASPKWDNLSVGASTTYLNGGTEPNWKIPIAADITIPSGYGTPTYDDMQDFLKETRSAGRITGGVITAHAGPNGTVDISEMEGMIFETNALGGVYKFFKMPAATAGLALTDLSVNWIYFDYNGGAPRYLATVSRSDIHEYDQFSVGRVWCSANDVEVMSTGHNIYDKDRRSHNRLILKYGNMDRASGAEISAHATPLRLTITDGSWYVGNHPYTTTSSNTFQVWYKTGGGAWTESSALTLFSEVFDGGTSKVHETYQNGTSLGALTANKYGVYWIFLCPEGDLYVILGTNKYDNIGSAQAASVPASLPPYCVNWARLVGRVIIKNSAAAFYSVETVFATSFTMSAAVDHASLANLTAADSHPQAAITGLTTADTPDFTGVHATTGLFDHIGEHTVSHTVVIDNAVYFSTNTDMPLTTDPTTGVINIGAVPFLHGFKATATTGENVFVGGSGNFTMHKDAATINASRNVGVGRSALSLLTHGSYNMAIGAESLYSNTTGSVNSGIGYESLYNNTDGYSNTAIGAYSLYTNISGYGNVAIGLNSGYYETGNNKLFIDNATRASEADGRAKALVYGVFDATTANQYFTVNGTVTATTKFVGCEISGVVEINNTEPVGRDNGHLWYDADGIASNYSIDILQVEVFSGG